MNERETILKLTKKNYTIWRLLIIDQLQRKNWFGITVHEERSRDRNYYNRSLRERKRECLQFLFSTIRDIEIYEKVEGFDQPSKVWSYLEVKYSNSSIKRLTTSMNELQTIQFNLESFDLFIEKFKKIVDKVEECGLELEDSYLNIYFLSSLERSKRIQNPKDFYGSIDCTFDEFLVKIKNCIIHNPDIQYSDISNESISFGDEDNSFDELNEKGLNSFKLTNLDNLNSQIDKNLKQISTDEDKINDNSEVFLIKDCVKSDNTEEGFNKFNQIFPGHLSPIKLYSQSKQLNVEQMEIDDQKPKVYEDLNRDQPKKSFVLDSSSKGPFFRIVETKTESQSDTNLIDSFSTLNNSKSNHSDRSLKDNYQLEDEKTEINDSSYFFVDKNGNS